MKGKFLQASAKTFCWKRSVITTVLVLALGARFAPAAATTIAQGAAAEAAKPLTPEQLQTLIPATVFFRGKSAPVQIRNAGGIHFADGGVFFAVLVDTSGYASNIQETYQFYLVTESPIRFGGKLLQPGAYGAGFVNDRFIVMDIGGHTLLEGDTMEDKDLKRPRPLQLLPGSASEVKLYLGRHYVVVSLSAGK